MPVQLSKANLKCQAGQDAGTPLCWSNKTEELGQQDLKGLKIHTARMMFREKVTAVTHYGIKFPLQQATLDWLTCMLLSIQFSNRLTAEPNCWLQGKQTRQAPWHKHWDLAGYFTPHKWGWTALPSMPINCSQNFPVMVSCMQDGEPQDTRCPFLLSGSQHYQNILLHNKDCI